jgi:hypothetical protein
MPHEGTKDTILTSSICDCVSKKHLEGDPNWAGDQDLIMCGFEFITGGRKTAMYYSRDGGETWTNPRYVEPEFYSDGGYADFFYNPTSGQYILVSYVGPYELSHASLKQYNITVDWTKNLS